MNSSGSVFVVETSCIDFRSEIENIDLMNAASISNIVPCDPLIILNTSAEGQAIEPRQRPHQRLIIEPTNSMSQTKSNKNNNSKSNKTSNNVTSSNVVMFKVFAPRSQ